MISDLFLQELKNNSDIEQIVSSYVQLKRRGRVLSGLCPFHSEKSPSFTVYPDNQSFYCFGCGAGGDVITFIRRIENLEYVEDENPRFGVKPDAGSFLSCVPRRPRREAWA